ncbi:hypothetical protein [Deinococcus sp.]|uniref:hypothetical protein n=1 Tax=Deinococcus sp. TaxID=47478 RepID=UPI002869E925|nr:hypothetical protein [Deinococcus sp.]
MNHEDPDRSSWQLHERARARHAQFLKEAHDARLIAEFRTNRTRPTDPVLHRLWHGAVRTVRSVLGRQPTPPPPDAAGPIV